MRRLEVLDLYELGGELTTFVRHLNRAKVPTLNLWIAFSSELKKFIAEQQAFPLARDSAVALLPKMEEAVRVNFLDPDNPEKFKVDFDPNAEMDTWHFFAIKNGLGEFEHVFSAVCRKCETYFVEPRMGFDVSLLLHEAEQNIHESIRPFLAKEVIEEIKAAGRCIALENYTASGFHTLRGLDRLVGAALRNLRELP